MIDHVLNDVSTFERFRPLLLLLARNQLGNRLKQKLDEDDLVQQTLTDAYFNRHQFRGRSDGELSAWLQKILYHKLLDTIHSLQAGKRDIRREVSFRHEIRGSSSRSDDWLVDHCHAPDQFAELKEQIAVLRNAVRQLPPQQRQAIEQFYLQEDSLKEISARMNCSAEAVSSMLYRGLRRLRSMLVETEDLRTIQFKSLSSRRNHSS